MDGDDRVETFAKINDGSFEALTDNGAIVPTKRSSEEKNDDHPASITV